MKTGDKVKVKANPFLADIMNKDLREETGLVTEYPYTGPFKNGKTVSVALVKIGDMFYPIGLEKLEVIE